MRTPTLVLLPVLAFAPLAAAPLAAQATRDQAQLTIGLSGGLVTGSHLWSVGNQPISFGGQALDTFALSRRLGQSLVIGFQGSYFFSSHVGVAAQAVLLSLGYDDQCTQVAASGDGQAAETCNSIHGRSTSGSISMLTGGLILRGSPRGAFSPYFRADVGLSMNTQSPLALSGSYRSTQPGVAGESVELPIYVDERNTRVAPAGALAAGITTQIARGYQIRTEIRDNLVSFRRVAGPTGRDGLPPPERASYRHVFSITVGFDVVLERRRGRRY